MSKLSAQEISTLHQIREGGHVERMSTGRKCQPFQYWIKGCGVMSPGTFAVLRNAGFLEPINDGETVHSLPRFYEAISG